LFWIAIAFFCATHASYAQADPTVHNPFPAGSALINIGPNSDNNLTLGGEYKSPKNVVTEEKPAPKWWSITAEVGYESEYIFRGGTSLDTAFQYRFKELDVFSSYSHSFGPLDITVGNIAFFIWRSEVDQFRFTFLGRTFQDNFAVPEDEVFDRLFISLSTSKI